MENILELEIEDRGEMVTIKELLKRILIEFWEDPEGFSGKSPFGESDWQCYVYHDIDKDTADKLIIEAIKDL